LFRKELNTCFLNQLRSPLTDDAAAPGQEEARGNLCQLRYKNSFSEKLRPRSAAWFGQLLLLANLRQLSQQNIQDRQRGDTDLRYLSKAKPIYL